MNEMPPFQTQCTPGNWRWISMTKRRCEKRGIEGQNKKKKVVLGEVSDEDKGQLGWGKQGVIAASYILIG
jgi:hypothetical protein